MPDLLCGTAGDAGRHADMPDPDDLIAKALAEAYTFLRQVEHLLQLHRLRRTHVVPTDVMDLRRLGRGLAPTR